MKRYASTGFISAVFMVFVLLFSSCGGGGSSGSSSGGGTNTYSGLTTPAQITEDNAEEILLSAFSGGDLGSGISGAFSAVDARKAQTPGALMVQRVALKVRDLVNREANGVCPAASAVQTQNIDIDGECGGSLTGTINVNDETGAMSGSLTYSNFCEMGARMNGAISFSGSMDLESGEFSLNMTCTNITEVDAELGINVTMTGTVTLQATETSMTMVMDIYMRDNAAAESFLMEDYTLTMVMDEYEYSAETTISGRLYCSEYGYVTLSTQDTIIVYEFDEYPSQGAFVATGASGSRARLTFISSETYRIEVDEDGNGDYEYDSGIIYWDE
ncbi:MAG TPA: hypothetical protein PLU54_06770 [Deltaproteobacteria bacterium]|nr:hypothetical protein [Deltaproteobacteria bacterium]